MDQARRPPHTIASDLGRVGVLTFHRCINYGSYWQAKCLIEGLQAMGRRPVLLDHCDARASAAEFRTALRPTLPTPVPRADVPAYKRKARKFLAEFERLPLSQPFPLDRPEAMEPLDTVIVGSDEVWNLRHPWYGGRGAFWGYGLRARRVVAYAASFGNYSCWEGLGAPWTDVLGTFQAISVRDENSWWMLKNAMGIEVPIVLDPALQFPLRAEGPWLGPEQPFALVYGHNFSEPFARQVRAWSRRHNVPLLSIGYRNDWADVQWLDAGPHDFALAMKRAEAVVTNFFHGCVFALRNGRPLACELTPYRSIKVSGLAELLGLAAHVLSGEVDPASLDRLLCEPPSVDVALRIAQVRATSQAFLCRALGDADVDKAA